MNYQEFLKRKVVEAPATGFEPRDINPMLFDWQAEVVRWNCRRGRSADLLDCGMGKTGIQLEWSRQTCRETQGNGLILAPLAVARQTQAEGEKFGIPVTVCRTQKDVRQGINITNYEMLEHFDCAQFSHVVLDESSILKSLDGSTRNQLIESFKATPYKLCCTATPAPNDHMELGNHAEFLGVMSRVEMLSMFFVHDGGNTASWRLKGHAEAEFWRWMASWAIMARRPSDLGYSDYGFSLPSLNFHEHRLESESPNDTLFPVEALGLMDRRRARRDSSTGRVARAAELINDSAEPWLVWCDLNEEGDALEAAISDAVQVKGAHSREQKEAALMDFVSGKVRALVTKPSIAGHGLNLQHCPNMAFVGLSDSWEQFYQAVRRCWRFGQHQPVNCHIIISEREGAVLRNIQRKETQAQQMAQEMVKHMKDLNTAYQGGKEAQALDYVREVYETEDFTLHRGDCIEVMREMPDASIDFSVFSPPFAQLYTYSNSERDMGNCKDYDEFFEHFGFLAPEMFRLMKPGRLVAMHCFDIPAMKARDGYIGLIDFPADLRRVFQEAGFIYHSKVTIWKDPVTQMQRTKALGLLHKQVRKDSAMSRQGLADYLIVMRKPGDNPQAITHTHDDFPVSQWQEWASPVWMDINPSNTLNRESAREEKDERHICALQLDVIERAITLWSNPGEVVFDPFCGIGSTVYQAIKMNRRGIGAELKKSYFDAAVRNCERAIAERGQMSLLEVVEVA